MHRVRYGRLSLKYVTSTTLKPIQGIQLKIIVKNFWPNLIL